MFGAFCSFLCTPPPFILSRLYHLLVLEWVKPQAYYSKPATHWNPTTGEVTGTETALLKPATVMHLNIRVGHMLTAVHQKIYTCH